VRRIASEEDAVLRVKSLREALADGIRAPPKHMREVHAIRRENQARLVLDRVQLDLLGLGARRELDVEANHFAAFARDDDDVAVRGVDGAFSGYVRERGEREDVHDAPDGVGGVAEHGDGEGVADSRVRAVAAEDVFGLPCFLLAVFLCCHGAGVVRIRGVDGDGFRGPAVFDLAGFERVFGLQDGGHFGEHQAVHAGLVEDDMREVA